VYVQSSAIYVPYHTDGDHNLDCTLQFFRHRLRSLTVINGGNHDPRDWMDEVTGWRPPKVKGPNPNLDEGVQRVQAMLGDEVPVRVISGEDATAVWRTRFNVGWDGMMDWGGSVHVPEYKIRGD
jgi:hypothetical protein